MKVHTIADIARGYNLENSDKLRNDIMNECEDIINSFPIIESDIIKRDISLLPVYELFGFGKKKDDKSKNTKTKIDPKINPKEALNKVKTLFNKSVSNTKYKNLKKIKFDFKLNGTDHYNDFIDGDEKYIDMATFNMEKLVGEKYNNDNEDKFSDCNELITQMLNEINNDLNKVGYTLAFSDDSEIYGDGGLTLYCGATITNESYIVDLDSLKYTMRYKDVSLNEAANLIKKANDIHESVELHCIMPNTSSITEAEYIKLYNTLLESGIVPCRVESINEDFNSWNISRLEKQLEKAKNNKKALQKKLDEFKKMDEQQQKQYCMNKTIKNLAIGTLAGLIVPVVGTAVHTTYIQMKGDNTILGPKNYKQNLSVLIRAYDVDIKRYEAALKSKTKK